MHELFIISIVHLPTTPTYYTRPLAFKKDIPNKFVLALFFRISQIVPRLLRLEVFSGFLHVVIVLLDVAFVR